MKPNDIARRLLPYIGVYTLDPTANLNDPNKRVLMQSDLEFLAGCITGAIAEIFHDGPAALSEQRIGAQLRGPTNVTLTTTQFDTAITFGGFASWMTGCTIRLGGDDQDNELISSTALLKPYQGTSGVVTATVWGDTVALAQGTDSVMDPVELPNRYPLIGVTTREEFRNWGVVNQYGNRPPSQPGSNYFIQQNKQQGQPAVWFCEARQTPGLGYLPLYMHFNPMPMQNYALDLRLKIESQTILYTDIGDQSIAPDVKIPVNWQESILMPYCAQRFQAHSSFLNKDARPEILRQFQVAQKKLLTYAVSNAAAIGHFNY